MVTYVQTPPHIRYDPPYGGHVVLRRDARKAYDAIIDFARACTDWPGEWSGGDLYVEGAGPYAAPDHDPAPIVKAVTDALGAGRDAGGIARFDAPSGGFTILQGKQTFVVPPERHAWAVGFALSQSRPPKDCIPPVSYCFGIRSNLRHPKDAKLPAWPPSTPLAEDGSPQEWALHLDCSLFIGVEPGQVSAHLHLVFPFGEPNSDFLTLVKAMRPHMPIKLSKANFRVVLPRKGKQLYKLRKIDKALFADL